MSVQIQVQAQKQLSDAMLNEVWTVMHLAASSDITTNDRIRGRGLSKHAVMAFSADVLESDSVFDGNANDKDVNDQQALKDVADTLAVIGDCLDQEQRTKEEEDKLVKDIIDTLRSRAVNINDELEKKLCSRLPKPDIFKVSMVDLAYKEMSLRLENFLFGSEGLNKIAMVTHITKGVSAALRDVSVPAVNLAAALSFRFVTENYADLILESGGLSNLVMSSKKK